jgi:hypothetical protein
MLGLLVIALLLVGIYLIRRKIRRQIEAQTDPMTWSEFEAEHGEAEYKADRFKNEHEAFLQEEGE